MCRWVVVICFVNLCIKFCIDIWEEQKRRAGGLMKVRLPVLLFMSLSDENNQEEEYLEEY